ncbi:GyrI-like domain-containing protein [Listeria booriae]|uniref:AraC family transcriptional regulator n=1 Tax=Listeria booriae TaxID=1552123 RepID=A0A842F0L1_9LIST|nr:effector binding domain-containing protein [Listeria booriae]MBC2240893.1 AraC family transcriptional regulator [Listeria booriae]MBC2243493.1 AraC family transcriptional regulator [Listeria booriae]
MEKQLFIINEVRTNNFNDSQVADKIGALWEEAKQYQQENQTFYGIYMDYESDFSGDYSVRVATDYQAFVGAETIVIPQQQYHVFPVENDVFAAWQEIWKLPLDRSYVFDYEEYLPDGSTLIHIGLKA